MRRIRLLRLLLPAVLVLFLVLVVVSLNQRPSIHGRPSAEAPQAERFAKKIDIVSIRGGETALDARAELVEPQADGGYHLEEIERLGIARSGRAPLLVQAAVADVEGDAGERRMRIRDQVVVRDPEEQLVLTLPRLDVDEITGEARSDGEIRFESPRARGRAGGLVYGLKGQPSRLEAPVLEDEQRGRLRADRAVLYDGLDDVEFLGSVSAERGEESLEAGRLRVWRSEDGRIRRVEARDDVAARVALAPGSTTDLATAHLEAEWGEAGRLLGFRLDGPSTVARAEGSLNASRVDGRRVEQGPVAWRLRAGGTVYLNGTIGEGPAWLRAESLRVDLDAAGELHSAEAAGGVRYESGATRAEADTARVEPRPDGRATVRLETTARRKARVARERTRVAADRITTDLDGERMVAEGGVEATLLPTSGSPGARAVGMFQAGEAIHFVSRFLDARHSGTALVFREGVRGWQGERNLAADLGEVDERAGSLVARGDVTTRIPRDEGRPVVAETDYIQVVSAALTYKESSRLAVYTGDVRLNLREGWLESEHMEVRLAPSGGIEEVRASGEVKIEFRDPDGEGAPELVVGSADRLVYLPAEQIVRLFGDESPAAVRRLGARGATTTGRVLRYRLDVGTLEVEPGDQAPARIRGS